MITITDIHGRDIDIDINVNGDDIYTLAGIVLVVPTGTPQDVAVNTIEAMAPWDYVAPLPPTTSVPVGAGNLNYIINGDMSIDQRFNGGPNTIANPPTGAYYYTLDRWSYSAAPGSTLSQTMSRYLTSTFLTPPPPGFPYCLRYLRNANYSPPGNHAVYLSQGIEGDLISDLLWGTSDAKPVTLSFWVYCSVAGLHGGSIKNPNTVGGRGYPFSYTVPVTNQWSFQIIQIPGDATVGAWPIGNGLSIQLNFALSVGGVYAATPGVWGPGANIFGSVGQVGLNNINNTFAITGVKLEVGNVATPFQSETPAKKLADCQRYFQIIGAPGTPNRGSLGASSYSNSTTFVNYAGVSYRTLMRALPTVTLSNLTQQQVTSMQIGTIGNTACVAQWLNSLTTSGGQLFYTLNLDAELLGPSAGFP